MNSHLTSWLMISAAFGVLLLAGRLEMILIAGPVSLVVGLVMSYGRTLRQRKILSEK